MKALNKALEAAPEGEKAAIQAKVEEAKAAVKAVKAEAKAALVEKKAALEAKKARPWDGSTQDQVHGGFPAHSDQHARCNHARWQGTRRACQGPRQALAPASQEEVKVANAASDAASKAAAVLLTAECAPGARGCANVLVARRTWARP